MDSNDRTTKMKSEMSINDENNNLKDLCCSTFEREKNLNESMKMAPIESSSDEDSWNSMSSSSIDEKDRMKYWEEISHWIKCVYRENHQDFRESHLNEEDFNRLEGLVKILTRTNGEWFFGEIESIVIDYVKEIRDEVLQRFDRCGKTSLDIQLFISYLLDEYHSFVQSAQNVFLLVSTLEEEYLKSFQLTWLLYNKHLYEEFVYMDKDIHESLSKMIDLLQPSNDQGDFHEYSPAEYTQLLNRFLAFDEEMSEIACLYKVSQQKRKSLMKNRNETKSEKKNDSPIESGIDAPDGSSISSVEEYLLENQMASATIDSLEKNPSTNEEKPKTNEIPSKKPKSSRRKENCVDPVDPLLSLSKGLLGSDLIPPRKPSLSSNSKLQADLRPLTIPLLSKNETSKCPTLLSAKLQSASFTPNTFGSIVTSETPSASSIGGRLNLNLRTKLPFGSPMKREFASSLIQSKTFDEILSSIDSSSMFNENKFDFDSDSQISDDDHSERLQIRLKKRPTPSCSLSTVKSNCAGKKSKGRPIDENIDELVKFIDGEESQKSKETKSKKKKKKEKQKPVEQKEDDPSPSPSTQTKESFTSDPTPATRRSSTPSIISEKTSSIQSTTNSPSRSVSPTEEEQIHWITIARKPTKQKPTHPPKNSTIPATQTNKSKQKPNKTNPPASQKIASTHSAPKPVIKPTVNPISTTTRTSTKKSQEKPSTVSSNLPNPIPKAQPTSCWKKINENSTSTTSQVDAIRPKSTLVATAAAFIPSASRIDSNSSNETSSSSSFVPYSNDSSSRTDWDSNPYLLPLSLSSQSTLIPPPPPLPLPSAVGPVQRPTGSFSSASNFVCIQRPSSEPRSSPFPFYSSSSNYNEENSQSIWTNNSSCNSSESLWPSSQEPPMRTSPTFEDFPLYDPFKSGTGLALPLSSSLPPGFQDFKEPFRLSTISIGNSLKPKEDFQELSFDHDSSSFWDN